MTTTRSPTSVQRASRRRRAARTGLLATAAALIGILPLALVMAWSHGRAVTVAEQQLREVGRIAVRLVDRVLDDAERVLTTFARATDLELTPEARRLLQEVVYDDLFFREAGVIDADGVLQFSTADAHHQPLPIPSDARADPSRPELQVLGRFRTRVMGLDSVIVALAVPGRGEVNLLIDPRLLTVLFEQVALGPDGRLVFASRGGAVLAVAGSGAAPADVVAPAGQDRLQLRLVAGQGEIQVVLDVDRDWVLREWHTTAGVALPVAVAAGAASAGMVLALGRRRPGLHHDLAVGLDRGELMVEYQPIVDLETGRCVGAEALLRWQHPEHGRVAPSVFVPLAEAGGMMELLTEWVVARVTSDMPMLRSAAPTLFVSVNCSPSLFVRGGLERIVDRVGVPSDLAASMILEVTENVFVDDRARIVAAAMARLRQRGFRFALDDFGTGYSALASLNDLHFDFLKIDRVFVQAVDAVGPSVLLLDTLLDLATRFGAEPVAEGIETEAQRAYVVQRAVRLGQGWLFAASFPIEDFVAFVQRSLQPSDGWSA